MPREPPTKPERAGKGGAEHTYLQEIITRWAQERGYRASVESEVPDGRVDVYLERPDKTVACEIAVTTTLDHELGNVLKCLRTPAQIVAVVSLRKSFLEKLARIVGERVDSTELERVRFFSPEELLAFLAEEPVAKEGTVAGYTVKVKYAGRGDEAKRKALAEVIARGIKKLQGR